MKAELDEYGMLSLIGETEEEKRFLRYWFQEQGMVHAWPGSWSSGGTLRISFRHITQIPIIRPKDLELMNNRVVYRREG